MKVFMPVLHAYANMNERELHTNSFKRLYLSTYILGHIYTPTFVYVLKCTHTFAHVGHGGLRPRGRGLL